MVVESVENLNLRDFRDVCFRRIVERNFTFFDELHDGRTRDRFGARPDRNDRVDGHRCALAELTRPDGALVDRSVAVGCHCDDAWNAVHTARRMYGVVQNAIDGFFESSLHHYGVSLAAEVKVQADIE